MIRKVSIFCASSQKVNKVYFQAAETLGRLLARNNIAVNYGGGEIGLMGKLANTILQENGQITGIIPRFMVEAGWSHPLVNDLLIVEDMHERKRRLRENVDAIIAMPGGVGTMEELLEMITLKQLGQVLVPIIILNINGFYDHLILFFERMIEEHFMRKIHRNIWTVVDSSDEVIKAILSAPRWDGSAVKYAPT